MVSGPLAREDSFFRSGHQEGFGTGTGVLAIADAGPRAGLGHLARTSALVVALGVRGIEASCRGLGAMSKFTFDGVLWEPAAQSDVIAEAPEARAIVLDSYELRADELAREGPLACFYDGSGRTSVAAASLVIAPALEASGRSGWLCGLEYACLRPSYWGLPPISPSPTFHRILVTTGADPEGIARALVAAAISGVPRAEVRCVRGPQTPPLAMEGAVEVEVHDDLRPELALADLVLCLGGQTALEAACLGVPTVAIAAVENQHSNVARLAAIGAIEAAKLDDELPALLAYLAADPHRRAELGRGARAAVDGFGALRVAAALEGLLSY